MANEKYLFVVSGAAGTGKDSVVGALRKMHPAPRVPGSRRAWITTTAPGKSSSS